ncbi:MAG: hypothetical protein HY719_03790, partial [Planctomycetes bacterium]|nr:hypothetical protein [Planctomycetota bacterium]
MKPAARPLRCFLAAATLAASLLLATPARAATIATLLDECDAAWLGLARESGGGGEALSWTRFQIVETLAGPPPAGETPTALLAYDRRISHQPRPEPGRTYLLFTRGIGRPADPAAPAP